MIDKLIDIIFYSPQRVIGSLLLVILFIFIISALIKSAEEVDKELDHYRSNIGNKIVLEGDTLLITSYTIIDGGYITRGGEVIDFSLAEENLIKQ